jgi:hypothetical protein
MTVPAWPVRSYLLVDVGGASEASVSRRWFKRTFVRPDASGWRCWPRISIQSGKHHVRPCDVTARPPHLERAARRVATLYPVVAT